MSSSYPSHLQIQNPEKVPKSVNISCSKKGSCMLTEIVDQSSDILNDQSVQWSCVVCVLVVVDQLLETPVKVYCKGITLWLF